MKITKKVLSEVDRKVIFWKLSPDYLLSIVSSEVYEDPKPLEAIYEGLRDGGYDPKDWDLLAADESTHAYGLVFRTEQVILCAWRKKPAQAAAAKDAILRMETDRALLAAQQKLSRAVDYGPLAEAHQVEVKPFQGQVKVDCGFNK